jgi:CSLREA domain-containing protein
METSESSLTVLADVVIRQTPAASTIVPAGSGVNLAISSGLPEGVNTVADGVDVSPGDGICETALGNGVCTLRAAIQEANAVAGSETITLPPGTYTLTIPGANEDGAATGDLDITDALIIESSTGSAADVVISGNALDRVFDLPPGGSPVVTLRGLTIQEGIIVDSTGGGVRNAQGALTMEDCEVTANQSSGSGGGLSHLGGTLTLRNTMVINNTSQGLGGGLQAQSGAVVIEANTQFMGNTANFGGGLSTGGADVTLTNVQVEDNTAEGGGGGIYKFLSPGDLLGTLQAPRVELSNTTVQNNTVNDCEGYIVNGSNNTFGTTDRCVLLPP